MIRSFSKHTRADSGAMLGSSAGATFSGERAVDYCSLTHAKSWPRLRVTYDISVLGAALYHARSRTGIARVIESVLEQLVRRSDLDLKLSATWGAQEWIQSRLFLEHSGQFAGLPLLPPGGFLARALTYAGRATYPAPGAALVTREWFKAAWRLLSFPGRNKLSADAGDVFHATYHPLPTRSSNGPARCLTVYDMIPVKFPQYFEKNMRRSMRNVYRSVGPADHVLAISQSTRDDFCEYTGIQPSRVHVTSLAAAGEFRPVKDPEAISRARKKYGVPDGNYALSLCTLEPRKNIAQTIRSFLDLIREQHLDDLNLVLVGTKGWMFDSVFAAIDGAAEFRDRIVITGFVPDEDLPAIYSGASMFVYPSLYEGFGLPPLEAMQCGVPVITSNTSSLPEVVGDTGLMVDPTDGDALSQAMLDVHRDASLRAKMREAGLARARQFTWKQCADQTVAAYRAARDSR